MLTKLKAIIIDSDKDNHDYTQIQSKKYFGYGETGFELVCIGPNDNILKTINDNRDVDAIITIGDESCFVYETLNTASFQIRKKWCHFESFEPKSIVNAILSTFTSNIGRESPDNSKLFSFFTCTFNTPREYLYRLYL